MIGILTLVVFTAGAAGALEGVVVDTGAIDGSEYEIAVPRERNDKLLMVAHGLRSEDAPLYASVDQSYPMYSALLADGWIIAAASFRRNGWIVDEAMEDLDNLYAYIAGAYGEPEQTLVLGSSMGGHIVVRMAERDDPVAEAYDGFVSVCAALGVDEEPDKERRIRFTPRRKILFLSNQNELGDPTAYTLRSMPSKFLPAVWGVIRDGHCNLLAEERLAAVRAMDAFLAIGELAPLRNATVTPEDKPSVAVFGDGWARAAILSLHPVYGNVTTEFVEEDLARLGIRKGSRFRLRFGGETYEPLYGTTYGDVERGEWVAFAIASGYFRFAMNFADAAAQTGWTVGDTVSIAPALD